MILIVNGDESRCLTPAVSGRGERTRANGPLDCELRRFDTRACPRTDGKGM